jgi:hypothetical protein
VGKVTHVTQLPTDLGQLTLSERVKDSFCQWTSVCSGAVVEALRYKPEVRGIDSQWCHWNFSLT